jgi:DNA-binding response OmpR family regulator
MKALRILLADDSPSIGEMICGQLRSNGHQVRFVTSGEAAVAAFREETPELVLMDIEMPGIGGLEAIRRIRRIPTQTWVPVIIVTGHHDEAHLLDGFMAGADDYLHKPVQPLLLDLRIQAMIRIVASQRSATATVDHSSKASSASTGRAASPRSTRQPRAFSATPPGRCWARTSRC